MRNHYLEQFKKEIEKYAQRTDICLTTAESSNMKGAVQRRKDLKEAMRLALIALEKLKRV